MNYLFPCGKNYLALIVLLFFFVLNSYAQQANLFDGNENAFHVNMGRYFKTKEEEISKRTLLLDSVMAFENDTSWNDADLSNHLDKYEWLRTSLKRHSQYFRLAGYINNKDAFARSGANQTNEAINAITTEVNKILMRPEFASLTDERLNKLGLIKYTYLIQQTKQNVVHDLSPHDEQLVDNLSGNMVDRLTDRYDDLMDNIKAEDIIVSGDKKLNPIKDRLLILENSDATVREAGIKAYNNAYGRHGELFAATLIDITSENTAIAKIMGFTNAPSRSYNRKLQVSEADVKTMLSEISQSSSVLKDYQHFQAGQISHITGLTQIHSWDTSLPMGYTWQPKTYTEVKQLIINGLAPLGKEYVHEFAWLLDPANGALEIAGGPNRVTEFTSIGYPGVPISLYMKSYDGGIKSVLTLSHEGGHAIHAKLMSDNHIVPTYSTGPNFLFEAYALFNELLMLDELQKQENTVQGKAYFTKQFLDKLSYEVFTSAEEGAFEQELYDGVAQGKIKTRDDVDSLYSGIMNKYDIFFADEPERRSEWINKRLLFDDPLYNINYLYAILVSCKLYSLVHEDPNGFDKKYIALLKNGFDAPADELLKKFMGFGLDNTALLNSTLHIMQDKTVLLKKLYEQMNNARK